MKMKKINVASVVLVVALYAAMAVALSTKKVTTRETLIATNTATSADSSTGVDTFLILGNIGQYSRFAYTLTMTQTDSLGSAVPIDTMTVRLKMKLGSTFTTFDSQKVALSAAGTTVTRGLFYGDSLAGVSRLRGDELWLIVNVADSVDIGASLGADSTLNYVYSLTGYFSE